MKKLQLRASVLSGSQTLSREQMKNVMGGLEGPPPDDPGDGGGSDTGGSKCGTYPNCNSNSCNSGKGTCGSTGATKKCTCATVSVG